MAERRLRHSSVGGLRAACHDGVHLQVALGRGKPLLAVRTLCPDLLQDLRLANALHRLSAALVSCVAAWRGRITNKNKINVVVRIGGWPAQYGISQF